MNIMSLSDSIKKQASRSGLFSGLSPKQLTRALEFFNAKAVYYKKGDVLNTLGDILPFFGLVLSGAVNVELSHEDGSLTLMATVTDGMTFGESLCYLKREAPVYITAARDSTVMLLHTDKMSKTALSVEETLFVSGFIGMLARRTLEMNDRIQILSAKSIREKLLRMLDRWGCGHVGAEVTLPFDRQTLADYLGTERTALCRVLSEMKKEGVIDYRKDTFTLLKHHTSS